MAGRYSKAELKNMLHRSAYRITMTEGLEGVTVRKLTKGCQLSDPYLYQCYSDLKDLLTTAFLEIDKEVADRIAGLIHGNPDLIKEVAGEENLETLCRLLWESYWDYLMSDPERTVFYWRFYQSGHYTKDLQAERRKYFSAFVRMTESVWKHVDISKTLSARELITAVVDGTAQTAVRVHLGYAEPAAINKEAVFYDAFAFLFAAVGMDIRQKIY